MKKMETVAESWATFRKAAVPKGAGPGQELDMKKAFYAGAYFLLISLNVTIGDDSVSEDAGVNMLTALREEIEAFALGQAPPAVPIAMPQPGPSRIVSPDTAYTVPDPDNMRPLLQELGGRIGGTLPDGWGFNLLLFPFGEPGENDGGVLYISNAERASVLDVMRNFIRSSVQ
jgi:hypothetical protein